MSSSTPRGSRSVRALGVLLGVAVAAGSCGGASAQLIVRPSAANGADLSAVTALKIIIRDVESETPDVFGPFPLDGEERLLPATVPANTPFYVDVWGCPDVDDCAPESVIGRGCTLGLQTLEEGSVGILNLDLFSRDQPEFPVCPPPIH